MYRLHEVVDGGIHERHVQGAEGRYIDIEGASSMQWEVAMDVDVLDVLDVLDALDDALYVVAVQGVDELGEEL